MKAYIRGIWDVIAYADTLPLELFLGVLKLVWGGFLLLPWQSFSAPWKVLGSLVTEDVFGFWLLLIGVFQLIGVARHNWWIRAWTVGVSIPTWSLVALSLWTISPDTPGWLIFAVLVVANLWVFLRLRRRPHEL